MTKAWVFPLIIAGLAFAALGQQGAAQTRRPGLDSMDLLPVPRTASRPLRSVIVDAETLKVLQPLMALSRSLESEYRDVIIDRRRAADTNEFLDAFGKKTLTIYRSMFILTKVDSIPDEACELLTRDLELVMDIGRVAAVLRFGDSGTFRKEIDVLIKRFGVPASGTRIDGTTVGDRELLIAAMLRSLNSDFSSIKTER